LSQIELSVMDCAATGDGSKATQRVERVFDRSSSRCQRPPLRYGDPSGEVDTSPLTICIAAICLDLPSGGLSLAEQRCEARKAGPPPPGLYLPGTVPGEGNKGPMALARRAGTQKVAADLGCVRRTIRTASGLRKG